MIFEVDTISGKQYINSKNITYAKLNLSLNNKSIRFNLANGETMTRNYNIDDIFEELKNTNDYIIYSTDDEKIIVNKDLITNMYIIDIKPLYDMSAVYRIIFHLNNKDCVFFEYKLKETRDEMFKKYKNELN